MKNDERPVPQIKEGDEINELSMIINIFILMAVIIWLCIITLKLFRSPEPAGNEPHDVIIHVVTEEKLIEPPDDALTISIGYGDDEKVIKKGEGE